MAVTHTFLGKNGPVTKNLTMAKAIREKCLNCVGWNAAEVRRCGATDCPLHPFRFGHYPKQKMPLKSLRSELAQDSERIAC